MGVFPSLCAPQKDQSGSAAGWRSPKSDDQEDDGRSDHRLDTDEATREEGPADDDMGQ